MFKVRVKAAHYNASGSRMEFLVRDRLSWLRFLAFDLVQPTPDATTIGMLRERLTRSGGLDALFRAFDNQLRGAGYLAMGARPSMRRWSRPPDSAIHRTTRIRSWAAPAPPRTGPMNKIFRTLAVNIVTGTDHKMTKQLIQYVLFFEKSSFPSASDQVNRS